MTNPEMILRFKEQFGFTPVLIILAYYVVTKLIFMKTLYKAGGYTFANSIGYRTLNAVTMTFLGIAIVFTV